MITKDIFHKHDVSISLTIYYILVSIWFLFFNMNWTKEEIKLSQSAKIIQFLSKIYFLPFSLDYAKSKIHFSYFNFNTSIYVLLNLVPFLVVFSWFISEIDFYHEFLVALKTVYLKSDLLTMMIFPGTKQKMIRIWLQERIAFMKF